MDMIEISSLDPLDQAKISLKSRKKISSGKPKYNVVIQEVEDRIERMKEKDKFQNKNTKKMRDKRMHDQEDEFENYSDLMRLKEQLLT